MLPESVFRVLEETVVTSYSPEPVSTSAIETGADRTKPMQAQPAEPPVMRMSYGDPCVHPQRGRTQALPWGGPLVGVWRVGENSDCRAGADGVVSCPPREWHHSNIETAGRWGSVESQQ